MQDTTNGIVSTPAIDTPFYFNNFTMYVTNHYPDWVIALKSIFGALIGISIPISIFMLIGIVISVEGIKRVRKKEDEIYNTKVEMAFTDEKTDPLLLKRWRTILDHTQSANPNDWKQAIIDADVILNELLIKLGYQGDSIGERLKRVIKGDFLTIRQAWDAHMVRNEIAHGGSNFNISQAETIRVINLYRSVFDEFYHISM